MSGKNHIFETKEYNGCRIATRNFWPRLAIPQGITKTPSTREIGSENLLK